MNCPACEKRWKIWDNQFIHVLPDSHYPEVFKLCLCLKAHRCLTTQEIEKTKSLINSYDK